jgi:two-component sensor histidine kinase
MASMWNHGHDWWRIFAWQLYGWGFWALAAPLLLASGRRMFRSRPWWGYLPRSAALGVSAILAQLVTVTAVALLLQPFVPVGELTFAEFFRDYGDGWFYMDLIAAIGLIGVGHMMASSRQARSLELQESLLEAELAKAQLEALRLQIEPHFLFNALNSITALVRRGDSDRALEVVQGLSGLLRDTVERAGRNEIALRDELEFVSRYLGLQKTRFGERLEVVTSVPEECLDLAVPTLLLQALVENSIRHGLNKTRSIRIEIDARVESGALALEVADDGPGLPEDFDLARDAGTGLGNILSRLAHLYQGRADLEIGPRPGGGAVSRVRFPATRLRPEPQIAIAS